MPERPASLTIFGASPSPAVVTVTTASPGQRFVRAGRSAGVLWAFAVGFVFVPGLHFVLVPTFLILGAVAGLRQLRGTEVVSGVHGTCPRCGREQDFTAGNRLTPSWRLDCPACHNTLTLTLEAEPVPSDVTPRA
ncbi:MAG TPA: hypothetical protein VKV41_24345 [Methylomirabilota bacterium]|nr:hypothetical protein [Methylomirabilota bacterium]